MLERLLVDTVNIRRLLLTPTLSMSIVQTLVSNSPVNVCVCVCVCMCVCVCVCVCVCERRGGGGEEILTLKARQAGISSKHQNYCLPMSLHRLVVSVQVDRA